MDRGNFFSHFRSVGSLGSRIWQGRVGWGEFEREGRQALWRLFFFLVVVVLFRAATMTYGDFQAKGGIRAVATGLHHSHSNAKSKLRL